MASVIIQAVISPSYYLSLVVARDNSATDTPDAYRVKIDGVATDCAILTDLGFDRVKAHYYLQRVARLISSSVVSVTVTPLKAGAPVGAESAALEVTAERDASPETVIRSLVADVLTAANLSSDGETVYVYRDRLGLPRIVVDLVGVRGPVVEVGVPFMTSEATHFNSTDTDTAITVPIKAIVKGDKPDRGQDAVDLAYLIRGTLAEAMSLERYGVVGWTWSGGAPVSEGDKLYSVSMQMSIMRVAERGLC